MNIRSIGAVAAALLSATTYADNPQFTQTLAPSDGSPNDYVVGGAVLTDTIVLGAPDDDVNTPTANDGAAYVFSRGADGSWAQLQKLTRADITAGAQFGAQVRLTTDGLLFVSAERNQSDTGAVFVYVRQANGTYNFGARIQPTTPISGSKFGASISYSNGRLMVGAPNESNGGAVYVFTRSGSTTTFTQSARVVASDTAVNDTFGACVVAKGNVMAVGSPGDTVGSAPGLGSVTMFFFTGSSWTQVGSKLSPSGAAVGDGFGSDLDFSGSTLVAGWEGADVGAFLDGGATLVYSVTSSGAATLFQTITHPTPAAGDRFGDSVSIADELTMLIGARYGSSPSNADDGAVWVYRRSSSSAQWAPATKFNAPITTGTVPLLFGIRAYISGETVVVPTPYGNGAATGSGAAYVYDIKFRDCDGDGRDDEWELASGQAADCNSNGRPDNCDISAGTSQDVNSDGVPDECQTFTVPGSYATIQAAIDATPANTFRIISVAAGTYNLTAGLVTNGKWVLIRGAGIGQTILNGSALSNQSILRITGFEPSYAGVEGCTFTDGNTGSLIPNSTAAYGGGAILATNSSARIKDCRFQYCRSGNGGAINWLYGDADIRNCQFQFNATQNGGGAVAVFRANGAIRDCTFNQNTSGEGSGSAMSVTGTRVSGDTFIVADCSITSNKAFISGSAVAWADNTGTTIGNLRLERCTITGNRSGDGFTTGAGGLRSSGSAGSCVLSATTVCNNLRVNASGPRMLVDASSVCDCDGDLNGDGSRNGADLGILIGYWGLCDDPNGCIGDLNFDNIVDGIDLGLLLGGWGTCPQ